MDFKKCEAVIWHGPGHQSFTNCPIKYPHTIHHVNLYGDDLYWIGDKDPEKNLERKFYEEWETAATIQPEVVVGDKPVIDASKMGSNIRYIAPPVAPIIAPKSITTAEDVLKEIYSLTEGPVLAYDASPDQVQRHVTEYLRMVQSYEQERDEAVEEKDVLTSKIEDLESAVSDKDEQSSKIESLQKQIKEHDKQVSKLEDEIKELKEILKKNHI
jgi:predicted RNase H-like nuclease (RuvC/YqgF family)